MRASRPFNDPLWYKDAVIYELHVKAFSDGNGDGIGDFQGLTAKLDYLEQVGVTCLWLLPFYPSPLRDDGYDIASYIDVHPSYGTLADFRAFLEAAHARGLNVITELVLNHTSDQHPWFQAARRAPAGSPEREFYVWSDTLERYRDARVIFRDAEPSNWTWDPVAGAYYWHRFFRHQPDLNFDNPAVGCAILDVVRFWLDLGVDGLRLDAVPHLFEREGTTCENLPETHAFLKTLRSAVDARYEGRVLLAEVNQAPADLRPYFGDGDECHMAFHVPLMSRLFVALAREDASAIVEVVGETADIPSSCQWALFLRNHDELTLSAAGDDEREVLFQAYAPEAVMRLNRGIRRRLAPLAGHDRRTIELLNALLCSLPGSPVIYYGDEVAMADDVWLPDRDGLRLPMPWEAVGAQDGDTASLLSWTKRLLRLRRQHQACGRGSIEWLEPSNPAVLAFVRRWEGETLLVVANLAATPQRAVLDLAQWQGMPCVDLLSGRHWPAVPAGPWGVDLAPRACLWFDLSLEAVSVVESGRGASNTRSARPADHRPGRRLPPSGGR